MSIFVKAMDIRDFDFWQGAVVEFRMCTDRYMILQLTIIEYSSIGYIDNSDFLFGSAFQIMHMHRDLSTYNGDQTHT